MDAPLNEKIDRTLKRKAARKKNDSNYMPVLSLREQVLALVSEANSKVPQERHVTPRSALIVMNRALSSLSSLDDVSLDFAVIKEVSRFLNVATKTFTASQTDNIDLLVAGHPLSSLNASISAEEFLKKNAQWIAADPSIDESIRPLVASAHAATPGSLERQHAFARLSANKIILASYFKLDNLSPIVAAFGEGNSSAARRARVALQWRDKKGRWVEMGRGANFSFRMPNGSVASASGVYVGVRPKRPGENYTAGLIQVSGDTNLPDGIYAVRAGDVETYAARITPAQLEKAGVSSKPRVDQNRINVPSRDELVAARLDAPAGWTKNSDNTFNSDDNYTVKGGDGEYTLYRQNEDGSLGDKVGEGANWADINDLANEDQVAYDAVKGQDSSAQQEQIKARLDIRTAHNAEFDRLEELVDSGVDQNGNKVPAGWEGIVKPGRAAEIERRAIGADRVLGEEGLPYVEYKKAIADDGGNPVFAEAAYDRTGKFAAYDKRYDSWEAAEADIPRWIAAEEKRRDRKLTPVEPEEIKLPELEDGPSDVVNPFKPEPAQDDRAGFFDRDGNRLPGEPAGDDPLPALTKEQTKKIDEEIKALLKNPPTPTEMDKRVEQLLKEQREEYDKAIAADNAGFFDKNGNRITQDESLGRTIYERRIATGDSLDKVAKDLGIPREEVRRLEAEYGRTLDSSADTADADKARNIEDVDKALKFLDAHMDDEGLSESAAMGIYYVQSQVEDAKRYLENGNTKEAISSLGIAFDIMDGSDYPSEGRFPTSENSAEAQDIVDKLITRLEESQSPTPPSGGDGPGKPTPPSGGGSNAPGSDFSDYVIDLASGNRSPANDLQEQLDVDVEELAVDFIENIYQDASDEFDLSETIKDDKPEGMSDKEFIDGAAAQMRENLEAIVDRAVEDRNDFVESGDAEPVDFDKEAFINIAIERYKELIQEELDGIREDDGDDGGGDGPDEPPTPPSGGTPPKTPSPNVPSAPGLFNGFNVPDGAFKFNTVDYTPEGRVDETSTDFTDDPQKLAIRFTPQDLVQALSQAMLGNSTDAALAEILNANVDDDNDILDPAEIQDSVNIPQVNLGVPSGAGQLEFSAGAEFVPAEALFNAIWEAGLDPNRVVANIYDSVNGNNDNLNKLIDAQGGVPSQEEAQLVDDIVQEIRQLKDASAPGDSPVANEKQTPSPDPLPGSLIENIPIDFNNPDYYIPNPESYIPSQPEVDENGYTDNPEILSADYEVADLIEQMLSGITDGSGAALLAFDNITVEVPVEAMRDAIQYQGINTNQILLDLKKESNDMSEPDSEAPSLQSHSQMIKDLVEQTGNTVDDETADKIRDAIDEKGLLDWSEADDAEIIEAITDVAGPGIVRRQNEDPRRFPPTTGERQAIERPVAPAKPAAPAAPDASEVPAAPSLVYPGPENRGYSADNTVLDIAGKVMGNGTRVRASRDGRIGTVIAVQNIDSRTGERIPYVRVRFDDGSVAVRSALKVRATGDAEQAVPTDAGRQAPTPAPVPDISSRLDAPVLNPGAIATEGNIQGVNSLGTTPDRLVEFTNPDAKQSDYSAWGLRAGEIARAGQDRVKLESIKKAAIDHQLAVLEFRAAPEAQKQALSLEITKKKEILDAMMKDAYGVRDGVTFGKNGYSLSFNSFNVSISGNKEELESGNQPLTLGIGMNVLDSNGRTIGSASRTVSGKQVTDPNTGDAIFEWQVKNSYLAVNNAKDKKSGFATAYNRFMEDWYIANGIKEIHVQAAGGAGYQGGFVWALNGFNWETPASAETEVFTRLRLMRRAVTDKAEIAQIDRLLEKASAAKLPNGGLDLDKTPTPMELALVGWYPGAKTWIGKDVMGRNGWMGVKRLDPVAKEQVQSINYDQIRAARKRIEAKENRPNVGREFVMTANSNEFGNKNPELGQYLTEIRDVLQNNRSLAVLSPAAKTALNKYVTKQLLTKEGRDLPMQDIFQLRKALQAEAKADNPLLDSTDFGVGKDLASATIEDISRNKVEGFQIKRLGVYESGYNDTWLATHVASGQRFYVKKDDLATNYDINGPLSEIVATNIARGIGFEGAYNTLASSDNPNVLVMQEAGATLPLGSEVQMASKVYSGSSGSLTALDGSKVSFNGDNFIDKMHTPEDAVRIVLLDLLINNQDRHNGNVLYALDGVDPSKIRIFPIDHSLSSFSLKPGDRDQYLFDAILGESDGKIYDLAMPGLTRAMKEDDLLALFRNEANALRESLKDGNIQLTGKELEMIVAEWGSLNNYRAAINKRLDAMLKPNGAVHARFLRILKPSFWTN